MGSATRKRHKRAAKKKYRKLLKCMRIQRHHVGK